MKMTKWEEERPPAWNVKTNEDFKKGAKLAGKYIERKQIHLNNGTSMLYMIEVSEGKQMVVWGTKKLDDFFKAMSLGVQVELEYLGKSTLVNGNTFHDFELEYDKDFKGENLEVDVDDVDF